MLLPEKTVTFDFPGLEGFEVDLVFLSKESNQKLYKKCQIQKFDKRTREPVTEFDEDLFLKLYTSSIIKGWSGLKLKYLSELVLADVPEEMQEDDLEYTEDNALELMKNSQVFDNWVASQISDLGKFTSTASKPSLPKSKSTSKSPPQV